MRTILLGGLEARFREQLGAALTAREETAGLQALPNLSALSQELGACRGDLLILDLQALGPAALDWLALVAELRSPIPVLAMGQNRGPDIKGYERRFPDRYFPFVQYLRKPVDAEYVAALALRELNQTAWGVVQGLSLTSLLQMLAMERKTCTIRISSGRRQGYFYLREGELINARYRGAEGTEAALWMIGARAPRAEIDGDRLAARALHASHRQNAGTAADIGHAARAESGFENFV